MTRSPADVRFSQFRWLIAHAGWEALPVAPGEDTQGPDLRDRIGKDGVVFSAYRIPRGSSHFGRVDLDPLPQWAEATGLACDIPVEELCAIFGYTGGEERSFVYLDSRLEDVISYLRGDDFARGKLDRATIMLRRRTAVTRDMLYELRPRIGLRGFVSARIAASVSEWSQLARYRRARKSLRKGTGPE